MGRGSSFLARGLSSFIGQWEDFYERGGKRRLGRETFPVRSCSGAAPALPFKEGKLCLAQSVPASRDPPGTRCPAPDKSCSSVPLWAQASGECKGLTGRGGQMEIVHSYMRLPGRGGMWVTNRLAGAI